jgi:hypothetical protein
LEYAERINFNEHNHEGLNFDLSERIKALEEQNEELKFNHDHSNLKDMEKLETKLEELENEKKELIRTTQKSKAKYDRIDKEREAKVLAIEKIKLLQKEIKIEKIEKKKVSDQLFRSYNEISFLKNFERENKSLKKEKTELLEEIRQLNRENHKLSTKIMKTYEKSQYGGDIRGDIQGDSDFESPAQENHNYENSLDHDESGFLISNSQSMIMPTGHKKNISLSKYLNNSKLNETTISMDRSMNRFHKKILVEKDKEIDEKNKEMEEISRVYEEKLLDLNKSRTEERSKYEKNLKEIGSGLKVKSHKRNRRIVTNRTQTPINVLQSFYPDPRERSGMDHINDHSDELDSSDSEKADNSQLFAKIDQMQGRYSNFRESIISQINDNTQD